MKLYQMQNFTLKILSFILLLACALQFYAFGSKTLTFFNIYTFLLIALSSGYLLFVKNRRQDFIFKRREVIYLAVFFLFHLLIRFNETTRFSMWWDELVQLSVSNSLPFIDSSAQHIQPPLGFVLEKLTLFLFGLNDFGARLSTVFCSLLGNFLFFALLLKITRSGIIAFVFSSLLAFEPRFLTYSIDARPMGLSFLLLVCILIELVGVSETPETGPETQPDTQPDTQPEPEKKINLRLLSLFVLFIISLGMQPVLIAAAMFIAAVLTGSRGIKKILLISLILYLPIHYKILIDSSWKVPVQSAEIILKRLLDFRFNNYLMIRKIYLKYFIFLACLLFASFTILRVRKVKSDNNLLRFFTSTTILFFLGAIFVFSVAVNYFFAPHYALLGLVLLMLTCALAYEKIIEGIVILFEEKSEKKWQRWLHPSFGILFITVLPVFNLRVVQDRIFPIAHEDLRGAYAYISKTSGAHDLLLTLSFPLKQWNPIETNMATDIYYSANNQKNSAQSAPETEIPLIDLYKRMKNQESVGKLYIIFQKAFNQVNLDWRDVQKFKGLEIQNFDHLMVFVISNSDGDFKKTWFSFLDTLSQNPAILDSWVFNFLQIERDLLTDDAENFKRDYYLFMKNTEGADNRANIEIINKFIRSEAQKIFSLEL